MQDQTTHMPIKKVPQDDKGLPMSKLPKEKSGLPKQKGIAETSFMKGQSGRVFTAAENLATMEAEQHFHIMDHSKVEVRHKSVERGGLGKNYEVKMKDKAIWYNLFAQKKDANGEPILSNSLTKEIKTVLGPFKTKTELMEQKYQEIQQKAQEREEVKKTIEENRRIADDKNEQSSVRDRARQKVTEDTERDAQLEQEQNQLEQEREQLVEKLPLRERLKDLFKKHGFILATVVTAVGITIGVIAKILADGASAAANGTKTVGKKVGDGLKELGKKIGSILPGLVGAIASFVFRAAGQAITFLGKNAWLLILFVAAFLIEKITKKRRE